MRNIASARLRISTLHAVYSRQRVDIFKENDVVCTESARQHKAATDLVMQTYQDKVGTLGHSDHKGINNQYVDEDKCVVEGINLIRRLTPLECERLQGFPDFFTDIPQDFGDATETAFPSSSYAVIPTLIPELFVKDIFKKRENFKRPEFVREHVVQKNFLIFWVKLTLLIL